VDRQGERCLLPVTFLKDVLRRVRNLSRQHGMWRAARNGRVHRRIWRPTRRRGGTAATHHPPHNERPNARHPLARRATGATAGEAASPARQDDGSLSLFPSGVLAAAAASTRDSERRHPPRGAPRPRPGRGAGATPGPRRRLFPRHPYDRFPPPAYLLSISRQCGYRASHSRLLFLLSCCGAVQRGRRSCCGSRRRSRRPSSSRPSRPPATPSSKPKLSSVIPFSHRCA
jgi:hypothetical protein